MNSEARSFAQSTPLAGLRAKIRCGYAVVLLFQTQGAAPVLDISAAPAAQDHPDLACILSSFAGRDSPVVANYVDTFESRSRRRRVTVVGVLGAREEASADWPARSLKMPAECLPAFNGTPIPYVGRPGMWERSECQLVAH